MVPQYNVRIWRDAKIDKLQFPPKRFLNERFEYFMNRDYEPFLGYSWDEYENVFEVEKNIINLADKNSTTLDEFEEYLMYLQDESEENIEELLCLDAGIASVVFALSAAGAAPFASCRAHPNSEDYALSPTVGFFAKKPLAQKLLKLARKNPVGLQNVEFEEYMGLEVYAKNVTDMMNFSEVMYKNLK